MLLHPLCLMLSLADVNGQVSDAFKMKTDFGSISTGFWLTQLPLRITHAKNKYHICVEKIL